MKHLRTLLSGITLRTLALGTFCAMGAFAVGIETAGDVHPFSKSEAAIQEIMTDETPIQGDANGNGTLDADDAYIVLQASDRQIIATEEEVLRGDMDGDGILTRRDLTIILRLLSLR